MPSIDFVLGFDRRDDAERSLEELRERLAKFGLELHPGEAQDGAHLDITGCITMKYAET